MTALGRGPWLRLLLGAALALYAAHILIAIATGRALFLDGAFFFVAAVDKANAVWPYFDDSKHIRLFVNLLNQWPLAVALKAGITDPALLRGLFAAPLFLNLPLLLLLGAWICRRGGRMALMIPPVLGVAIFTMASDVFIINPAITAVGVYWVLLLYALVPIEPRRRDLAIAALLCLIAWRSHETALLAGPVIALAALIALPRAASGRRRLLLAMIALSMLGAAAFTAWWQVAHPVGQATGSYLSTLRWSILVPEHIVGTNLLFTMLGGAVATLLAARLLLTGPRWANGFWGPVLSAIIILAGLAMIAFALIAQGDPGRTDPILEYEYRSLITFGMVGTMIVTAALALFWEKLLLAADWRPLWAWIALIVAAQSIWQIGHSLRWASFAGHVRAVVAAAPSPVIETTDTPLVDVVDPLNRYGFFWTWPALSIALSNERQVHAILTPTKLREEFRIAPGVPPRIPFATLHGGVFDYRRLRE